MMDILEKHDQVPTALEYLQSVPHTGNGTMILLDKTGDMAVFEIAHTKQQVIKSPEWYSDQHESLYQPGVNRQLGRSQFTGITG